MASPTIVVSPGAAARLAGARRFVDDFLPTREVLIVGATREAAEDFARDVTAARGATFGLHRLTLFQVAVRLATPALAAEGLTPATGLALHAVITRTAFETLRQQRLSYLQPIAACPGFPRALLATLGDARHARIGTGSLAGAAPSGPDLAALAEGFDDELREARLADRAEVIEKAIDVLENGPSAFCSGWPLVLLDTSIASSLDAVFVRALLRRAGPALVTVPAADEHALAALRDVAVAIDEKRKAAAALPLFDQSPIDVTGDSDDGGLSGLQRRLFTTTPTRATEDSSAVTSEEPLRTRNLTDRVKFPGSQVTAAGRGRAEGPLEQYVEFFSAPGEGRESVEIARRVLEQARLGVPFDRMAVALRSPREYAPLLANAFTRAGIPACFARGTAVPDPAGRALLALLACAGERLSARRFAEYLSLGQVPSRSVDLALEPAPWTAGEDEVVPQDPDPPPPTAQDDDMTAREEEYRADTTEYRADTTEYRADTGVGPYGGHARSFGSDSRELVPKPEARSLKPEGPTVESREDLMDGPVRAGSLRTPWRWERLLVDAAVAGGADRWRRRLEGLTQELRARRQEAADNESDSSLLPRLDRDIEQLGHIRDFALPIIDMLAAWPALATWREWLERLEEIVPRVLRQPERVVTVLGDLRALGAVGPIDLEQVRRVLHERLTELHEPPPQRRYGRVFVGTPDDLRGRVFDLVFVPGLAERVFPQRPRQDPLLLDEARKALMEDNDGVWLRTQEDRTRDERLLLSIAIGAASRQVCVSYPRMQMADSRPRVPSFYAIDLERARTGVVPDVGALIAGADRAGGARLAWPAPSEAARAIDDIEHDLSVLRRLLHDTPPAESRGRARYLFSLNAALAQSLRARYVRSSETRWTQFDGLKLRAGTDTHDRLQKHRLRDRPYSVSAIQRFAACPYRFFLSTIQRLEPREDHLQLERLDPLTRGHLFHRVQAETIRALKDKDLLPVMRANVSSALAILDNTLARVADEEHDNLVPAIDRVWHTEIESMGADLHAWLQHMAEHGGQWVPAHVEWGFGLPASKERDPASQKDPVTLDDGWQLHGAVDLIERRSGAECRVTDHKTGFARVKERFIVDGGESLQPILYAMAVEKALDVIVTETRLFYCTAAGRFAIRSAPLDPSARRQAIEVLEIVDRAVEHAFLPAAPKKGACKYCDFRLVCGPGEERRAAHKDQGALGDLLDLREMK